MLRGLLIATTIVCIHLFCLESFNEIKYAAYRTALKLRAIQKLTQRKNSKMSDGATITLL